MTSEILNCTVAQFLQQYPDGRSLLDLAGLVNSSSQEHNSALSDYLTLGSLLRQRGLNPHAFLDLLAGLVRETDTTERPLRVEANVPCALKAPLEIALQQAGENLLGGTGATPQFTVQSENESAITNQGASITNLDAMPDLIIAAGYNTLLDHAFMGRFATAEHFAPRLPDAVNNSLASYGFADPLGIYRVIGINVFVFVVDPLLAKGRKTPDSWEALLDEAFVRDVAVCGMGDKVSGSLMLHVQARFGDEAVRKLGRNVRCGMHPSQVIKYLGTGNPQSPTVAVMPYFFARLADIHRPATVVWPRDGAVAMPFFQLVKQDGPKGLDRFAAHMEGPEVGRICSGAFFPSLHEAVPCPLPGQARLAWLGWDSIRRNDLAEQRKRATNLFEAGRAEFGS